MSEENNSYFDVSADDQKDLSLENIIYSFSCRFSLDKVAFSDSDFFTDHSYQLNAELYRDTVLVSYRSGQHNETIPSLVYENIVDRQFMYRLDEIIRESDVAYYNNMHRHTHGLPEGYGCAMDVRYKFGPGISLSNNSFLYFTADFMQQLIRLFYQASGAAEAEAGSRLNGVSYSISENGVSSFQAYLLLNRDSTVSLEYYDRKNFRTVTCRLTDAVLTEIEQLWRENDLEYAFGTSDSAGGPRISLDLRFGRKCCCANTAQDLTNLQQTALENVRGIIEKHLQISQVR